MRAPRADSNGFGANRAPGVANRRGAPAQWHGSVARRQRDLGAAREVDGNRWIHGPIVSTLPAISRMLRLYFFAKTTMGNRLSKIATRTGDDGSTGLGDGSRTAKDSARVAALGDVDELNSFLGLLLCEDMPADLREELVTIQHDLFDLGGELCIPGYQMITDDHVVRLDALLAKYNATLPALKEFILPAGSRAASTAHVCRTVCRRAERSIVALARTDTIHAQPRQYMNRLSDLMFVLARVLNRHAGGGDVLWQRDRERG
jgi:cob(I)alamin adenosyltransferase